MSQPLTDDQPASPEHPIYTASPQASSHLWLVTCDEGWRSSVVCSGMYEWAALWLVEQLGRRPFAPETRP